MRTMAVSLCGVVDCGSRRGIETGIWMFRLQLMKFMAA